MLIYCTTFLQFYYVDPRKVIQDVHDTASNMLCIYCSCCLQALLTPKRVCHPANTCNEEEGFLVALCMIYMPVISHVLQSV